MSRAEDSRFDSWKEIADYLHKDIRTARRYEKDRKLPVWRVPGGTHGAVYAYRSEIDTWLRNGNLHPDPADRRESKDDAPENRHEEGLQTGSDSKGIADRSHSAEDSPPKRSATNFFRRTLIITGALALLAVFLAILISVRFRSPQNEGSYSGMPSGVPSVIEHWLRTSFVNSLPTAVTSPFQQQIIVDSSRYTKYEAENLQNIEFFDVNGNVMKSWLESGNSNLSSHTVYWILLPNGMPASKVVNIYMGFAAKERNLFDRKTTGEAPGLSSTYGQYDNGNNVFTRYAGFGGNAMPPGWHSGFTEPGHGEVRVNNGVLLGHNGRGGGTAFLSSDWSVGHYITEMDLLSEHTEEGQVMVFICSASPTHYRWTPNSVGFQNTSGLEIEGNNSGTPAVLATATLNPTLPSVIGFQEGTLFANYQPVAQIDSRICGGEFLASSVDTGRMASFSFDWVRMRVSPPSGVMPIVIFGEVQ